MEGGVSGPGWESWRGRAGERPDASHPMFWRVSDCWHEFRLIQLGAVLFVWEDASDTRLPWWLGNKLGGYGYAPQEAPFPPKDMFHGSAVPTPTWPSRGFYHFGERAQNKKAAPTLFPCVPKVQEGRPSQSPAAASSGGREGGTTLRWRTVKLTAGDPAQAQAVLLHGKAAGNLN